jgi:hypothetical protein
MLALAENIAYRLVSLLDETDLKIGNGILVPYLSKLDRHSI